MRASLASHMRSGDASHTRNECGLSHLARLSLIVALSVSKMMSEANVWSRKGAPLASAPNYHLVWNLTLERCDVVCDI